MGKKWEVTNKDEAKANADQLRLIRAGFGVSLVGYDGSRDVYAFDYWTD